MKRERQYYSFHGFFSWEKNKKYIKKETKKDIFVKKFLDFFNIKENNATKKFFNSKTFYHLCYRQNSYGNIPLWEFLAIKMKKFEDLASKLRANKTVRCK